MKTAKYMEEEVVIKEAMGALIEELGPVEAIRFVTMTERKRTESVKRHREWQKLLDEDTFLDEIFTE